MVHFNIKTPDFIETITAVKSWLMLVSCYL